MLQCGCERLALCGDDGVASDTCPSFFERLRDAGVETHRLMMQFRAHPQIAAFVSERFYGDTLSSGVTTGERPPVKGILWPRAAVPVAFVECGSSSKDEPYERRVDNSFANAREAAKCVDLAAKALEADPHATVALVTPYLAQANDMKKRLDREASLSRDTRDRALVGTVATFTGRSVDLVLFSATRSNRTGRLGLLDDDGLLKAVLSRPARGLVVVGSSATLRRHPVSYTHLRAHET